MFARVLLLPLLSGLYVLLIVRALLCWMGDRRGIKPTQALLRPARGLPLLLDVCLHRQLLGSALCSTTLYLRSTQLFATVF